MPFDHSGDRVILRGNFLSDHRGLNMAEKTLQNFKNSYESKDLQYCIQSLDGLENYIATVEKNQRDQLFAAAIGVLRAIITAKHPEILKIRAELIVAEQEFEALCEQERKALKLHHNLVATDNGSPAERAASWNHWCFQRSISAQVVELETLKKKLAREMKNV